MKALYFEGMDSSRVTTRTPNAVSIKKNKINDQIIHLNDDDNDNDIDNEAQTSM